MTMMRRRHAAVALLVGALVVGGALEIALTRSGAPDSTGGRWLRPPKRDTEWEAHLAVIDRALADDHGSRANARLAYLAALTRAQRDGSVDGVRRVARAFEALGDHAVAAQCARIARRLAERGGARPG